MKDLHEFFSNYFKKILEPFDIIEDLRNQEFLVKIEKIWSNIKKSI